MATNAKERVPVILYPTASRSDLLFYEWVNPQLPGNSPDGCGGTYGDPHWNTREFPHHRLVFRAPSGDPGVEKWYYAADRKNQDDYNWSIGQGSELIRDYLVLRSLYYGRSAAEAAATVPKVHDEFSYPVIATADVRFAKYGFADDTVLEAPEQLRSLYIVVKRRFLRPVVSDIQYDEDLGIRLKTTLTLVPATMTETSLPADTSGVVYELQPQNVFHSIQMKREVVPQSDGWTLADYAKPQGVRTNIPNLPRELVSVNVVWNSSYSIGTQDYYFYKWESGTSISLGKSANDSASSAASVVPELQLKFRDVEASNLPATEYEIFIDGDATEAAILARLEALAGAPVLAWPVFRPESVTINTTGQSINVRANVNISLEGAWSSADGLTSQGLDRGVSDDFSVNLTVGGVQIPACIHGAITITGDTSRSQVVSATAAMTMFNSLVGTNSATKTKSGTAYGVVTPTTIPAVSGTQTIPTSGLYAIDIRPVRNFLGYTRVTAIVFDASNLA